MNSFTIFTLFFISLSFSVSTNITNEFVILLISQPHIYILSQIDHASSLIPPGIPLLYTHSYASSTSNWYTIHPVFGPILQQYPQMKWLFIGEALTRLHLPELLAFAQQQANQSKSVYAGHGLYDSEPSIIHHYSFDFDNPYPDFSPGVLISRDLLERLADRLQSHTKPIDFIIDVKYELNQLFNELAKTKLSDRPDLFCYEDRPGCLSWYDGPNDYSCPREDVQVTDLYFGIKTFVDYHQTRLALLKKTWLNAGLQYNLFTNALNETTDDPNERFIVTKENTVRGHCHKTFFILDHFHRNQKNAEYLLIVDDDTLISVQRALRLIRCFMLAKDIPLVLGERYGYRQHYEYPTGGSGIILNRRAVQEILANCHCPSPDTPDDMFLGMCLKRMEIPLIHIPELHQAQFNAYSKDWLAHQKPISFHKFENIPVEQIYQTYLHEEVPQAKQSSPVKDEF